MSVNLIEEAKKYSKCSINTGNFDCINEGYCMYQNEAVKFPVKKPPANNECFDKSSKCSTKNTKHRKKKKSKK